MNVFLHAVRDFVLSQSNDNDEDRVFDLIELQQTFLELFIASQETWTAVADLKDRHMSKGRELEWFVSWMQTHSALPFSILPGPACLGDMQGGLMGRNRRLDFGSVLNVWDALRSETDTVTRSGGVLHIFAHFGRNVYLLGLLRPGVSLHRSPIPEVS